MNALQAAIAAQFPGALIAHQDDDSVYLGLPGKRGVHRVNVMDHGRGTFSFSAPVPIPTRELRPAASTQAKLDELQRRVDALMCEVDRLPARRPAPRRGPSDADFAPVPAPIGGWVAPPRHSPEAPLRPGGELRLHRISALDDAESFAPIPRGPYDQTPEPDDSDPHYASCPRSRWD